MDVKLVVSCIQLNSGHVLLSWFVRQSDLYEFVLHLLQPIVGSRYSCTGNCTISSEKLCSETENPGRPDAHHYSTVVVMHCV